MLTREGVSGGQIMLTREGVSGTLSSFVSAWICDVFPGRPRPPILPVPALAAASLAWGTISGYSTSGSWDLPRLHGCAPSPPCYTVCCIKPFHLAATPRMGP